MATRSERKARASVRARSASGSFRVHAFYALVLLVALGCSELIGADFDDARPKSTGGHAGDEGPGGDGGESAYGGTAARGGTTAGGTGGTVSPGGAHGAGDSGDSGDSGAAGSGEGGTAAGGTSGSGASGDGGMAGDAGASGAGPLLNCRGPYGQSRAVFAELNIRSLSVTGNELEIYYSTYDAGTNTSAVSVRKRLSRTDDFGERLDVPSIASACPAGSTLVTLDVSDDGLSLYFVCSDQSTADEDTLRKAGRDTLDDDFVVRGKTYGSIPARFGVSADERTLVSLLGDETLMWPRASPEAALREPEPIPGVFDAILDPESAAEGRELYGTVRGDVRLVVLRQSGAAYEVPVTTGLPSPPAGYQDASPALSADCRTLYFTRRSTATAAATTEVHVAEREICADNEDNDGDGRIDCFDHDCQLIAPCTDRESDCADDFDDEEDGQVDCMDPDCAGSPECGESACLDSIDNDDDGFTDCYDSECSRTSECD